LTAKIGGSGVELFMTVINFEDKACERVRRSLDYYLSNELPTEANLEAVRHLKVCPRCAEARAGGQRIKVALKRAIGQEECAPQGLEQRILKEIKRQAGWSYRWLAVAAIVVLTVGVVGARHWLNARHASEVHFALHTTGNQSHSGKDDEAFNLGLDDHINCALSRNFSSGTLSFEQISRSIGPYYAGLAPLVKDQIPQNYKLMAGHQCGFQGRNFVHLIYTDRKEILSIILTKKQGETFDKSTPGAGAQVSGTSLYQSRREEQESVGFETLDYLAYVVSGLAREDHLQIASRLIPSIQRFLTRLETE
jgi:hypothetical protein